MEAFLAVSGKVGTMLVMMAVGWIITKKGVLTARGTAEFTWVLLNLVTPCLIVSSFFSVKTGQINGQSLLLSVVLAGAAIGIGVLGSQLFFRKEKKESQRVLRFAMIFSNAGFMGMPLVAGIVGQGGVIFGSFFIAVFNLICWTYGYYMMSGGAKLETKKIFLNPGTIGLAIGLPVYLLGWQIPEVLRAVVDGFAALNTPLAMLVVGTYIARVQFREFLLDSKIYLVAGLRLLVFPLLLIGLLCLVRPERDLFLSTVIQACTPTAANCVLFAATFGADAKLASKTVAATTLLSVISIPIVLVFCQFLVALVL